MREKQHLYIEEEHFEKEELQQFQLQGSSSQNMNYSNQSNLDYLQVEASSNESKLFQNIRQNYNTHRRQILDNTSIISQNLQKDEAYLEGTPSNLNTSQVVPNGVTYSPQIISLRQESSSPDSRSKSNVFVPVNNNNNTFLRSPKRVGLGSMAHQQHLSHTDLKSKMTAITAISSLRASLLAKRFAQKLKLKARSQLFMKLTDRQFKLIGDLSCYVQYYHKQFHSNITFLHFCFSSARNTLSFCIKSESFLLQPNSLFHILWNVISFLFMVALLIIIPVNFCFGEPIFSWNNELIDFAAIFQLIYITIKLNQGIYKRGALIKKRTLIIKNYISKSQFWIDILILFTFTASLDFQSSQFLQLSIILKLGNVMEMYDNILNTLEIKQKNKHIGVLLKVAFQILLIAHLAGCFFIKLAQTNKESKNWVNSVGIDEDNQVDVYISAIYWSVITMITVGYGDITPKNKCQIFRQQEESKMRFQNRINDISSFMKKRQVNRDMREAIFKYLHHLHKEELHQSDQFALMKESLPGNLKANFLVELYSKIIKHQPFFADNFPDEFILKMCQIIKEKRVQPETNLTDFDRNKEFQMQFSQRLYFIIDGKVIQRTTVQKKTIVKIFERGECIGLEEFLTGQLTNLNPMILTQSIVMLAYIDKSDFMNLLDSCPLEKEKYFMIKDQVQFGQEISLLKQNCIACLSDQHFIVQCERLHLTPNKEKICFSANISRNQERVSHFQRSMQRNNSPFHFLPPNEENIENEQISQDNLPEDQLEMSACSQQQQNQVKPKQQQPQLLDLNNKNNLTPMFVSPEGQKASCYSESSSTSSPSSAIPKKRLSAKAAKDKFIRQSKGTVSAIEFQNDHQTTTTNMLPKNKCKDSLVKSFAETLAMYENTVRQNILQRSQSDNPNLIECQFQGIVNSRLNSNTNNKYFLPVDVSRRHSFFGVHNSNFNILEYNQRNQLELLPVSESIPKFNSNENDNHNLVKDCLSNVETIPLNINNTNAENNQGDLSISYFSTDLNHNLPPTERQFNLAAQNNAYFNKDTEENTLISQQTLRKEEETDITLSCTQLVSKRNLPVVNLKKPPQLSQQQSRFDHYQSIDDFQQKVIPAKNQNQNLKKRQYLNKSSLIEGLAGDDGATIITNTFTEPRNVVSSNISMFKNSNIFNSQTPMQYKQPIAVLDLLDAKIQHGQDKNSYCNEASEGDNELQQTQIQLFQLGIAVFMDSKVMEIDSMKDYEIFFPNYNSQLLLPRLMLQHSILKSPNRSTKMSRFKIHSSTTVQKKK